MPKAGSPATVARAGTNSLVARHGCWLRAEAAPLLNPCTLGPLDQDHQSSLMILVLDDCDDCAKDQLEHTLPRAAWQHTFNRSCADMLGGPTVPHLTLSHMQLRSSQQPGPCISLGHWGQLALTLMAQQVCPKHWSLPMPLASCDGALVLVLALDIGRQPALMGQLA